MFQELDDVYHDVSAVVAETLVQGADVMALKVWLFYLLATRWSLHTYLSHAFRAIFLSFPVGRNESTL